MDSPFVLAPGRTKPFVLSASVTPFARPKRLANVTHALHFQGLDGKCITCDTRFCLRATIAPGHVGHVQATKQKAMAGGLYRYFCWRPKIKCGADLVANNDAKYLGPR